MVFPYKAPTLCVFPRCAISTPSFFHPSCSLPCAPSIPIAFSPSCHSWKSRIMRGFGRNSRPLSTAHRPLFAAFSALTTRKAIARPDRLFLSQAQKKRCGTGALSKKRKERSKKQWRKWQSDKALPLPVHKSCKNRLWSFSSPMVLIPP